MYMVQSESDKEKYYSINIKSGYCECLQGVLRGPCKHKAAIQHYFKIAEFSGIPVFDNQAKSLYHFIAEGVTLSSQWYRAIDAPTDTVNTPNLVEHNPPPPIELNQDAPDGAQEDMVESQDNESEKSDSEVLTE